MTLNDNNVTFTHFDTTDYSNSNNANGNYLSGKSKVAFYAGITPDTNANANAYRMRIEFPGTDSYQTGHSRNLLSFTGNARSTGEGTYEWHKEGTGSIGSTASAGAKTLFTFGSLARNKTCEFWTNIRQYIKARHKDFRFTAKVMGESGKTFSIQILAFEFSIDETISITTTGSWQNIDIQLQNADRSANPDFTISVGYTGASGTTGTLQMIEPMLAVDGAFSNTYSWCPNAYDNYFNYPSDADEWTGSYTTESHTAYLDGIDNTFTPVVGNTSASGLYDITVHIDYFGSNDGKYDDTFDIMPKIDVSAYDVPQITDGSMNVYRSDPTSDAKSKVGFQCEILAFPINLTSPKVTNFRVRYKPASVTDWSDSSVKTTTAVSVQSTTPTTITIASTDAESDSAYLDGILEYKDIYMSDYATLRPFIIPTAFALMDYHSTGMGISFGRVATDEIVNKCKDGGIDMNLPIYYSDSAFNATHDASINQMIKQVSVSTVSTLPTGISSLGTPQVIRCGQVVTVQFEFTLSATLSNWTEIVSSGGMPNPFGAYSIVTTAQNWGATVLRGCRVSVGLNGNLQLRYGAAGSYRAQFTYITKDPLTTS